MKWLNGTTYMRCMKWRKKKKKDTQKKIQKEICVNRWSVKISNWFWFHQYQISDVLIRNFEPCQSKDIILESQHYGTNLMWISKRSALINFVLINCGDMEPIFIKHQEINTNATKQRKI